MTSLVLALTLMGPSACRLGYSYIPRSDPSDPFVAHEQQCAFLGDTATSWYEAQSRCLSEESHLLAFQGVPQVRQIPRRDLVGDFWLGARKNSFSGVWEWTDGTPLSTLQLRKYEVKLDSFSDGNCLSAVYDGVDLSVRASSCSEQKKFLCAAAATCPFQHLLDIDFVTNLFGNTKVNIAQNGVLRSGGRDVALGEWVSPRQYVVQEPFGIVGCLWVVRFQALDFKAAVVTFGCEGKAPETQRIDLECDRPVNADQQTQVPIGRIGGPTDAPPLISASPYSTAPRSTAPPLSAVEEDDDTLPLWIWFAAFSVVAVVSVFAAVGMLQRVEMMEGGKTHQPYSPEIPMPADTKQTMKKNKLRVHDAEAAATCEVCQQFEASEAQDRLREVHGAMQQSFLRPIHILGAQCEHKPTEHVHHFTLENDYNAPCLGALSTVYSRTKPRLPRNTRIHIEKGDKPSQEKTAYSDMVYTGAMYY